MALDRPSLDDLAVAVAERAAVEWDRQLISTEDPEQRAVLEQLQNLDRIAEAFWRPADLPARLGDFEILREIGRGGMGVVHEVRQVSLDRRVAIKVLFGEMTPDARSLQRFEREARALAALNHPNIVTIYSVEHCDGLHFINMELVDGETLATRIPRDGLPIKQLLDLAVPMADALSTAHQRRIIHRDLKPANVMINREGRVKILDFGLAKLRGERQAPRSGSIDGSVGTTREGAVLGTVPYMSPEQTKGKNLDHRSDLFAFGAMLYEMATGRRAFSGDSPAEVISSILHGHPAPVTEINAELPADLNRIIAHCLRKDPDQRYQTAKGLRNELGELRTRLELEEIGPGPLPWKPVANRAWLLPVALLTAAAAVFLTVATNPAVVETVKGWFGESVPAVVPYLAVLPFESLGESSPGTRAFSAGLTEVVTTKLTRLTDTHALQVAGTITSAGPRTVEEAAAVLGADLAVVGTFHGSGDQVRIHVKLVDVKSRRRLQARLITAGQDDPFALQDRIVVAVAEMLELELPHDEELLLEAHGTRSADAHLAYLQGRGYLRDYDQIENVDNAIRAFRQALVNDPGYAEAYSGLGMAYWKRFDHDGDTAWVERADEACSEALKHDDRVAEGHVCLGTVYLGKGRHGAAAAEFGWANSLDPTLDEAYHGLARVYEALDEPDAAEEVYRKAIAERPHYWGGYSWMGGFYYYQGRYPEAEGMFARVTEMTPESYRAHSNLGGTLILQGRFQEAIPVLERSIEIQPNVDGYSNVGTAYFKLLRYDDAVLAFQKAVGLSADDHVLWGNLAEAHYWSGRRDEARPAYRRAVELGTEVLRVNPKDPDVLGELAKYHAMLGDRDEAVGYLEQALRLAPADAELKFGAAVVYEQLGQSDTALDWLERAFAGGVAVAYAEEAPEFENLKAHGRFWTLLAAARSEEEAPE